MNNLNLTNNTELEVNETFIAGSSKSVETHEKMICTKQPEDKNLITSIAKHYVSMLKNYHLVYSKDEMFEFSFKLTIANKTYSLDNESLLVKHLAKLSEEENFIIEIKFSGNVSLYTLTDKQEPTYYFGEGLPYGAFHLLTDELKNCIEYKMFNYSDYQSFCFAKFDKNGLCNSFADATEDLSVTSGVTNFYTGGISMGYSLDEDSEILYSKFDEIARKYIDKDEMDEAENYKCDDYVGLNDIQWFLSSYKDLENLIEEFNQIDVLSIDKNATLIANGFWIEFESFSLIKLVEKNGKFSAEAIKL